MPYINSSNQIADVLTKGLPDKVLVIFVARWVYLMFSPHLEGECRVVCVLGCSLLISKGVKCKKTIEIRREEERTGQCAPDYSKAFLCISILKSQIRERFLQSTSSDSTVAVTNFHTLHHYRMLVSYRASQQY